MSVYVKPGSKFFWMLLEGTGRTRKSTGVPCIAKSAEKRKELRAQAEAVYHGEMVKLARKRSGLPIDSPETFARFATWYDTHHIEQHRSKERERVILDRLRTTFDRLRLSEIRPAAWTEYETERRAEGVGTNTIGRELAVMKALLTAAVGQHLEVNPLAHVARKTERLPPKRTITAAEDKALLAQLKGGKRRGGTYGDAELHDLYVLGVGTLFRQMNLITLQRSQVHGGRVVVNTKTGPHAVSLNGPTPLQRRAAAVLQRRTPAGPQGYYFPKWQARFAKDRNGANKKLLQAFRRACTRAGIPWGLNEHGVVWHTATRASGATRMLRDYKVDIRTVQLLGNWRSLDQMAEYLGVDLSALNRVNAR